MVNSWCWPLALNTHVPISGPGAFGAVRRFDVHTGVDLYCPVTTPVFAVENGVVVNVLPFTGEWTNSPWWHETSAIMVEGPSGVVLYGELFPIVNVGDRVFEKQSLGFVQQVLKKDKGRPMSMLHLELYTPGTWDPVVWSLSEDQPVNLLDPTPYLLTRKP